MGAWGLQAFENDDALEWVAKLPRAEDSSVCTRAFARIPKDRKEGVSAPNACQALAAAEAVAAALGARTSAVPDEVTAWVEDHRGVSPAVVKEARRVVRRILADSELKNLWQDTDDFQAWQATVHDLLQRLSRQAADVEPSRARPARRLKAGRSHLPGSGGAAVGDLRERAQRFMDGPLPRGVEATETQTHDFIRRYLAGGPWDEPGLQEDGRLFYSVVLRVVEDGEEGFSAAATAYYRECAEILRDILTKIYGPAAAVPFADLG
jgi:hypothetical protein